MATISPSIAHSSGSPHPPASNITPFPVTREPSTYGAGKRPNLPALATSIGIALLALSAFVTSHPAQPAKRSERLAVLEIKAPPPPAPAKPQDAPPPPPPKAAPVMMPETPLPLRPEAPRITATLVPQPSPPSAGPVATAEPSASPPAPPSPPAIENAGDLSSTMISATPPRYPQESRRKREEGVVLLRLTLGVDGHVAEISVAKSSGHARLDQAALAAVRRWRWSPTRKNGAAVQVKGLVEIPFVLQTR